MTAERDVSFESLLHPITVESFLSDYWEQRSLYVKGSRDKARALDFDMSAAHQLSTDARALVQACFFNPQGDYQEVEIDGTQWEHYLQGGMSLCFRRISDQVPHLKRFADGAKRRLGHPGSVHVNCVLSPPGHGFRVHHDPYGIISIQMQGDKRFRIGDVPTFKAPVESAQGALNSLAKYKAKHPWTKEMSSPREEDLKEVILEPGDVLYIPPGTWHSTDAITYSVGLNLFLAPVTYVDLLRRAVERALRPDERWRAFTPIGAVRQAGGSDRLDDWLRLNVLQDGQALIERLTREMRVAYHELTGSSALEDASQSVHEPGREALEISPADRLEVAGVVYCRSSQDDAGEDCLLLSMASADPGHRCEHDMVLDPRLRAFVRHLSQATVFAAEEAQGWTERGEGALPWGFVRDGLSHLLLAGFLRRAA